MIPNRGELWSFLRNVLSQGTAIQMDAQAGRYKSSEEISIRLDTAARERADEFERKYWHDKGDPAREAYSAVETPAECMHDWRQIFRNGRFSERCARCSEDREKPL
jgi:hypothetical protein